MLAERVAQRIKQGRIQKGWKQVDLAMALGVRGTNHVWKWESGRVCPGLDKIEQMAELFEVPPHWFFTPDDSNKPTAGDDPSDLLIRLQHCGRPPRPTECSVLQTLQATSSHSTRNQRRNQRAA